MVLGLVSQLMGYDGLEVVEMGFKTQATTFFYSPSSTGSVLMHTGLTTCPSSPNPPMYATGAGPLALKAAAGEFM